MTIKEKLFNILNRNQTMIIAIDGPSGSGKTTLVNEISKQFNVTIIHMDDYFLPEEKKTVKRLSKPGGNIDIERLQDEVFKRLESDKIYSHHFNCKTQTLQTRPALVKKTVVIIEGVYAHHPKLVSYYDLKVVCYVSRETQLKRLKQRSQPHIYERFINEWIPLEDAYFEAFNIIDEADIIIENE
ncbi:MAG: AAA family ATPase [Candidatus Izemoplasma sp.]|nr:AAA family ATPase [Candidatus Izemoplasma sp.]